MTRLALYGSGRWGSAILRTLERMADVTVAVVARDQRPPADIDGVIIATPISTHARLARPFIERGIPVYIEKPVTGSVEDARQLLAAAERADSLVHVGHIHLHNPAFVRARELAAGLGRIRYLYFEGTNNGPARKDASVLWDWLPHPLSMALSLLGATPCSAQAWGICSLRPQDATLCDVAMSKYEFDSGATLLCTVNWLAPEKRTALSVVGEKSSLVYTDTAAHSIALYEGMGPSVDGDNVYHHAPAITYPEYVKAAPLERELSAFITAIEHGSRDRSQLAFAVTIVELIAAAEQSMTRGGQTVLVECQQALA